MSGASWPENLILDDCSSNTGGRMRHELFARHVSSVTHVPKRPGTRMRTSLHVRHAFVCTIDGPRRSGPIYLRNRFASLWQSPLHVGFYLWILSPILLLLGSL